MNKKENKSDIKTTGGGGASEQTRLGMKYETARREGCRKATTSTKPFWILGRDADAIRGEKRGFSRRKEKRKLYRTQVSILRKLYPAPRYEKHFLEVLRVHP